MNNKKKKLIFAVIIVTCILCSMLSTALTTALPQIMTTFDIDAATGQWLTSIYSLVMGILVLATPFLIKRVRTKPLYLISLGIFTLGLLLDAFTSSFSVMMAGRVMQAAANGVLLSLGQVIILTVYPKEKHGSVMGIYGLAVSAAPVIAPAIAGLVVDAWGWRMIFYILLFIATVSLFLTALVFEDVLENEDVRFDFLSLTLCAAGFTGLLIGIGNLGSFALTDISILLPLAAGITCCFLFVYRQLHLETPFLDVRVLRVRKFTLAVIASMILYAYLMGISVLLPVYIQTICGQSATVSGLVMIPGSIAMALISPLAGRMYDQLGIRKIFVSGALLMTVSSLWMVTLSASSPMWEVAAANVVRSLSTGLLMMQFVTWGVSGLEQKDTASGTSLLTSLRTVSGAFGSAVFMAVVATFSVSGTDMSGMTAAFTGLLALGAVEILLSILVCAQKD